MRLRAAQGQRGRVVRTRADGGTTGDVHIQSPMQHHQLGGGQIAIHIIHADAGDGQLRVFHRSLRTRHGVDWRMVDARHRDAHGVAVGQRCAIAVGGQHGQGVGAAVVRHTGVLQRGQGCVDLRLGTAQRQSC